MNPLHAVCEEVLSEARGDERDAPEIREHLERCIDCRDEILEIRAMTTAVRSVMPAVPSPAQYRIETVERALGDSSAGFWSWRLAVGAAAAAALTFLLVSGSTSDGPSAAPVKLRVELEAPAHGHLHYVVHGTDRAPRYGGIELTSQTLPDTVTLDTVVADTF